MRAPWWAEVNIQMTTVILGNVWQRHILNKVSLGLLLLQPQKSYITCFQMWQYDNLCFKNKDTLLKYEVNCYKNRWNIDKSNISMKWSNLGHQK